MPPRPLHAAALALLLSACATPKVAPPPSTVTVGVLAINDFHGALEPPPGPAGAGGAAALATTLDTLRAGYGHSATVSAGDLIGASPLVSSLHLDEPTVGAMNRMGLDFNAVGNHEFDRGADELLRMQRGGCERHTRRDPCRLERFAGARFAFLAASTTDASGRTLFPATGLRRFGKGKRQATVGFIGLTLRATPELVVPDGVRGLAFGDEAEAINRAVPALVRQGADAVVVLIHEGVRQTADAPEPNGCAGLSGALLPILQRIDARVDLVVSGHTHAAYVCELPRKGARPLLLTSAAANGLLVTDIALEIAPAEGRVVSARARNVRVTAGPRADVAAYVARYAEAARPLAARVVGRLSAPAARAPDRRGGALGNLVADAQLAATRPAGAQVALTNPFGLRAPLPGGTIAYADIYAAQPFGNVLVTQDMTGAELRAALEQGADDTGPKQLLSPSAGFAYAVDPARPSGSRIAAMTLDGVPLRDEATYRVTTNVFLAGGGDGFTRFAARRNATTGMEDLDALERWIAAVPERLVPDEARVALAP